MLADLAETRLAAKDRLASAPAASQVIGRREELGMTSRRLNTCIATSVTVAMGTAWLRIRNAR